MQSHDSDPVDRQLFWTNIIGLSIVVILLGSFALLYGQDLLRFVATLTVQGDWGGH